MYQSAYLKAEQIRDIVILACYWLNARCGDDKPRRPATILRALHEAQLLGKSKKERQAVANNRTNRATLLQACEVRKGEKPNRRQLEEFARKSDKPLILIIPEQVQDSQRVFGSNGYFVYLTTVGEKLIEQLEREHRLVMNEKFFTKCWDMALAKLRNAFAKMSNAASSKAPALSDQAHARPSIIPDAPRSPEEFEWDD